MRAAHRDVARIALTAASDGHFDVALAGGNALHVHGITYRPTQDIDLFVRREQQVRPAAGVIAAALETSGYARQPDERDDQPPQLADFWPELGDGLVDMVVRVPGGGELVQVQAAHFDYEAVIASDIGPVLALDDVAAWKTHALVNRAAPRDVVDVAALLRHGYTVERLLALVLVKDPGLIAEDFADIGVRIDRMRDPRLEEHLEGSGLTTATIRDLFRPWPREPLHPEEDWR
jgi:hypothetical protein